MRRLVKPFASRLLIVTFSVTAILVSCGPALTPRGGPGTDYPCAAYAKDGTFVDINGVECGDGWCCDAGTVCGGKSFTGCPADSCCFVGDDGALAAREPHKKWKPVR